MSNRIRVLGPFVLILVLLVTSGCVGVAKSAGFVPQSDLDAANVRIAELEKANLELGSKLALVNEMSAATNRTVTELESKLDQANVRLSDWSRLLCKHTWDEFIQVSGAYPFVGMLPSFPAAEYEVFFTGWSTDQNAELTTTILVDKEGDVWSMAIDAVDDCLIPNPVFFTPTK